MSNFSFANFCTITLTLSVLTGCASVPIAPSVAVMPPTGKPFDLFQLEDKECKDFATKQINPNDSAQLQRTAEVIGSGIVGGLIGTAFGAIVGGHHAAKTGAIAGGITGGLDGLGQSSGYRGQLQNQYNIAYQQCMVAKGNPAPPMPVIAPMPAYLPSLGGGRIFMAPGFDFRLRIH